jgi:hypothetical protein
MVQSELRPFDSGGAAGHGETIMKNVEGGPAIEPDNDLTARALLVLGADISDLSEQVECIKVHVYALSRQNPVV